MSGDNPETLDVMKEYEDMEDELFDSNKQEKRES